MIILDCYKLISVHTPHYEMIPVDNYLHSIYGLCIYIYGTKCTQIMHTDRSIYGLCLYIYGTKCIQIMHTDRSIDKVIVDLSSPKKLLPSSIKVSKMLVTRNYHV